ncbi:conserved hypothetical protein [Campylobacter jejuni subsp. doylei 269.97]|uniref:Uncharacterized protein n=1 Tax=Campylobacter jejuni subsp. doylei (strain ATCC BAA-1458 / RM4099 / 269.97) TaxID=360109 RepID=A7H3Q5_CAMJD|nr:conserved hypothetical protein [Campylobacter jejuni subsp. doylei 269.97]
MQVNYENFQRMSKEEYYEKYKVGIRFLFGYDQKNDYKLKKFNNFFRIVKLEE